MAVNLGKLGFSLRGDWSGSKTYVKNEVVKYPVDGNIYIALQQNTGITPASLGVNWYKLTDGLTEQEHDIFTKLAAGTAQTLAPSKKFTKLATGVGNYGYRFFGGIKADGRVATWGAATSNCDTADRFSAKDIAFENNENPTIVKYVIGQRQNYLIDTNGAVWSFGVDDTGSLGLGGITNIPIARKIQFFITNGIQIKDIVASQGWYSTGQQCAFFITTLGHVYAVGHNGYGQLGNGTTTSQSTPVRCGLITGITWVSCSNEQTTVFAGNAAGNLWYWGNAAGNVHGTVATTNLSSPTLSTLTGVKYVAVSNDGSSAGTNVQASAIAVMLDGTVMVAGTSTGGLLGLGAVVSNSPTWASIPGLTNIAKVYKRGGYYANYAALSNTGQFWIWGYNGNGIVGDGTTTLRSAPYQPPGSFQGSVLDVRMCGLASSQVCALLTPTEVYVNGYNANNVIGDGTTPNPNVFKKSLIGAGVPVQIELGNGSENENALFVLFSDGRAKSNGYNGPGFTGVRADGSANNVIVPTDISVL
ncbi:MAG: hypothetical protein EBX50_16305 [Chitinophagia bacterium]|nr:hypothetical protein [Chitinophagia bacterium]